MILIPVVLCAAYLVMVSLCVCERMTPQTNHLVRMLVAGIGGAGFWALCKAIVFGWGVHRLNSCKGSPLSRWLLL